MPDLYGLSEYGFKLKNFLTIKEELETALVKEVDPTLQFGPGSVAGVLTGIVANQAHQVWESLQGLYHSMQPHTASGNALDALCSLTGTYRKQAKKSHVTVALTLAPHTKVNKKSRIQSIAGHNFIIKDDVINDSAAEKIVTSEALADEAGPVIIHKDSEAKIMTPIAGWSKAVFLSTLQKGCFKESDNDLRLRRLSELTAKGSSTLDAIKSRLLALPEVEAIYIKEFPRSFEVIVKGGFEDSIAQSLWDAKPLGVEATGNVSGEALDSWGKYRTIYFSRPTVIEIKLETKILVNNNLSDNDINKIKNSLANFAMKNFTLGSKVYSSQFYPVLLAQNLIVDILQLTVTDKATNKTPSQEIKPEEIIYLPFNNIAIEWVS